MGLHATKDILRKNTLKELENMVYPRLTGEALELKYRNSKNRDSSVALLLQNDIIVILSEAKNLINCMEFQNIVVAELARLN